MENIQDNNNKFYVIGLNHVKADAKTRGLFSVSKDAQLAILLEAKDIGIPSICVLSTCNRTEIYGYAENPFLLIKLLCKYTKGSLEDFEKISYVYREVEAIRHLFKVGTGLDSQILGDFEIISQLRNSFKQAKEESVLNTYMERLIDAVIYASKRIKNETDLSSGATSVSFAAVHYLMRNISELSTKNLLLFGTGKIGRNTVENLIKHTKTNSINLINRTKVNAEEIAGKYNLQIKAFENLSNEISKADVLIVATGAQQPTLLTSHLGKRKSPLLILDLSMPANVEEKVAEIDQVKIIRIDELSEIIKETEQQRIQEVPKAEIIIDEVFQEFLEWINIRKFSPTIRALKEKLTLIKEEEIDYQRRKTFDFNEEQAEILGNRIIQKILTRFASHLRYDVQDMEKNLQLITQVFQLNSKEN